MIVLADSGAPDLSDENFFYEIFSVYQAKVPLLIINIKPRKLGDVLLGKPTFERLWQKILK